MLLVAACGNADDESEHTVSGIVTEVTGDLTVVESFVVLDDDGDSHLFRPAPGLLFYGGPLIHLRDHVITAQRVTVTFEESPSGEMTAVLIEHESSDDEHHAPTLDSGDAHGIDVDA